jgi:hypothetical protein
VLRGRVLDVGRGVLVTDLLHTGTLRPCTYQDGGVAVGGVGSAGRPRSDRGNSRRRDGVVVEQAAHTPVPA